MDRNEVATGIGYAQGPPVLTLPENPEFVRSQVREWNEYGARLGQDYPGRFGLFANLPVPDIDGCLIEIEYALDVLNADGFGIATSYGGLWLGDPSLEPIFEEMDRRKSVVFVHPSDAQCCVPNTLSYEAGLPGAPGAFLEWPVNTARTIFSLMRSGRLRQFPNVRFIFSHGGGVMPLLIGRVAGFTGWGVVGPEGLAAMFPDGIQTEFATLYFELAQAYDEVNLDALRGLVPDSQLLFGSDYSRFSIAHSVTALDDLGLPANVRNAIERGNAEALFPRFRS